ERTQNIIYTLGEFLRKGLIPSIPVYIDSPLAISATEIFKRNPDCYDQETKDLLLGGKHPLELPQITNTRTTEESRAINEDARPGIIISASGMCDSGRIQHHLKHHLWRKDSHILFIGFQAEGTIGRKIVDGARTIRLFGEEIAIHAHIHTLGGFSAHADQKGLLDWLSHFKNPGLKVFVNHGEEKVALELADLIRQKFRLDASAPRWREKRILLGPETIEAQEEEPGEVVQEVKAMMRPGETIPALFGKLENNYRRLRRKLKRGKWKEWESQDPRLLKQLEEINRKVEELEEEL
ncbi:MAG: MBL fold metallo-hydrolase, partial [Deltaproteobacteria bacterium]